MYRRQICKVDIAKADIQGQTRKVGLNGKHVKRKFQWDASTLYLPLTHMTAVSCLQVTYKEMLEKVCRLANVLKDMGVKKGA